MSLLGPINKRAMYTMCAAIIPLLAALEKPHGFWMRPLLDNAVQERCKPLRVHGMIISLATVTYE